jgi:serine phosphatase RsbU (regulator of sigma subunit)
MGALGEPSIGIDVGTLLRRLPELAADDLGGMLALACSSVAYPLQAKVFLSDYQERVLVELGSDSRRREPPISVLGSVAGRAFVGQAPVPSSDGAVLWVPLTNRWWRLGVLRLEYASEMAARVMDDALALAGLVATVLESASRCTDAYHKAKREEGMALTADMQWDLLPPRAVAGVGVTMAGRLEPAYDVGGDAFDYAINGNTAHVAIFDPVGHDLRSATLCATAVGAYRHGRRSGYDLAETGRRIDASLRSHFPLGSFVTGQLFELDLATGELTWTNAGHPLPLLLRDGRAHPVSLRPDRPWGLGPAPVTIGGIGLQPADRLMVITDGLLEARSPNGDAFGLDRLIDMLTREAIHPGSPAEVLRRVLDAAMDHRGAPLQDDATAVLLEWQGNGAPSPLGG